MCIFRLRRVERSQGETTYADAKGAEQKQRNS